MKKVLLVSLAVALVLSFGSIAIAGTAAGTGIDGTFHDLSSHGLGNTFGETADHTNLNRICVYCHAPHNTNAADTGMNTYRPLWNHDASVNTTFKMYSNGTDIPNQVAHQSQAMASINLTPGSVSMLCLSCHDGQTATNSYGYTSNSGAGRGTGGNFVSARAVIGTGGDLSTHHPIGFLYAAASADDEIAPDTTPLMQGGLYGVKANGPQLVSDLLWNGQVECVSCHDVHNTKNGGSKFTWIEDKNSALCLTCHLKGTANVN